MNLPSSHALSVCRICGATRFASVIDLGRTPLANAFVHPDRAGVADEEFPLQALRCLECGLVQLSVVVRPDVLFAEYPYMSSASPPMVEHFQRYADDVAERFVPRGALVVEVGSNDGVLLRSLAESGRRVLGIEPARNLATAANEIGVETWNVFLSPEVARRAARERGRATAVLANNVLAHIDDLHAVVASLDALLDEDGVFIAEFPYLSDLLEHVEYDTIYHEHLSYFSLRPVATLFGGTDLELFDVARTAVHGGSVRIFVGRRGRRAPTRPLRETLDSEAILGLDRAGVYETFASRVRASRDALRALLHELAARRLTVAGIGATAKSTTLLNYCRIGPDLVRWIADSTPLKQGLLTPGTRIPIRPESAIADDPPDRLLLLAWNYADAIVRRFAPFIGSGGRFIHPIPLARELAA